MGNYWRPRAKPGEPIKFQGRQPEDDTARARRMLPPEAPVFGPRDVLRMTERVHPVTGRVHLTFYCARSHVIGDKVVAASALATPEARAVTMRWVDLWAAWHYIGRNECRACLKWERDPDGRARQNFL